MSLLQNLFKLGNSQHGQYGRILGSRMPLIFDYTSNNNDKELLFNQKRYAARKGKRIAATREKQRLARVRREELKNAPPKVWKPKKLLLDRKSLSGIQTIFDDSNRKDLDEIVDNVYVIDQYKERKLPLEELLALIRETHDPTMYDEPDALVEAKIELDLRTKKKTKFLENFRGIISFSNEFKYANKRKVIAICKGDENQEIAKSAGAEFVGGSDVINMLKSGQISLDNFDELVCHGDMLIELATHKKVLDAYFPTKQRGNIGFDMHRLVKHFVEGFEFKLTKDDFEKSYGFVTLPFGRLTQTDQQLVENFQHALTMIEEFKPHGHPGDFIRRVLVLSQPSPEKFAVAFWNYIDGYEDPSLKEEEEETPSKSKAKAKN